MPDLVKLAERLNRLEARRDEIALTLPRTAMTMAMVRVRSLKREHARLCEKIDAIKRRLR
jgi:hypothetical protein